MIFLVLVFSIFFEASFTNLISYSSTFLPMFLLSSLVILFPYFKNKNQNFLIVSGICGILYDIVFTNTLFINTLSFIICGILILLGYNYFNYKIYSCNILNIIIIILYRIISYTFLCVIDYTVFNDNILLKGIYSSILINIIYGIILYIILDLLSNILNIKRMK